MAKSLQFKQYMVSSLKQMSVRTQRMARVVSEDSAGLHTFASLRPARAGGGGCPSTTVQALWSKHYRPSTKIQTQQTKHYGPIATDQALRTRHY